MCGNGELITEKKNICETVILLKGNFCLVNNYYCYLASFQES